jgi:polar amino acid transport system substrate-binding protein
MRPFLRLLPLLCALAGALMAPLPAMAQAAAAAERSPGSGFADPQGIPSRPLPRDADLVYRGPAVDTLATVRQRGVLRIGVAASEPAVMHGAQGQLVGLSIDLGRRLAEDMGVQAEFVETSWSQVIPDLLDRQFDLIVSGMWVTPTRALAVNFSNPTASEGVYLVANRSLAAGKTSLADFNQPGVRLVAYAGTMQELLARRSFPKATLVLVKGDENHLEPLLRDEAHAALVPSFAPRALVAAMPDKLVLPLDERPVATAHTAVAMRKGDPDMLNYLNTVLEFHRASGWLAERTRYWSDYALRPR